MVPQLAMPFPEQRDGTLYLTDGGIETELLYKWGIELPHFATFPLLEDPESAEVLRGIYRRALKVAADHGMTPMLSSCGYRASPDWGKLLGYSEAGLAEATLRAFAFVRELLPADGVLMASVGPRGDAYQLNRTMSEAEAEDYHAVQLGTIKEGQADLAFAFTFNNPTEAIGVARAARKIGVPLAMSLTTDGTGRLKSGYAIGEAIERIDAATDGSPAFYAVNCAHPAEFAPAMTGDAIRRIRCLRPNASRMEKMALCKLGHLEEGDPPELGRLMGDLARQYPHMDIWGGCCGTGEVHLAEIARNVLAARRGD